MFKCFSLYIVYISFILNYFLNELYFLIYLINYINYFLFPFGINRMPIAYTRAAYPLWGAICICSSQISFNSRLMIFKLVKGPGPRALGPKMCVGPGPVPWYQAHFGAKGPGPLPLLKSISPGTLAFLKKKIVLNWKRSGLSIYI